MNKFSQNLCHLLITSCLGVNLACPEAFADCASEEQITIQCLKRSCKQVMSELYHNDACFTHILSNVRKGNERSIRWAFLMKPFADAGIGEDLTAELANALKFRPLTVLGEDPSLDYKNPSLCVFLGATDELNEKPEAQRAELQARLKALEAIPPEARKPVVSACEFLIKTELGRTLDRE